MKADINAVYVCCSRAPDGTALVRYSREREEFLAVQVVETMISHLDLPSRIVEADSEEGVAQVFIRYQTFPRIV